jgi:hypothetical protein
MSLAAPVSADSGARPFKGIVHGSLTFEPVSLEVCPAGGAYVGGLMTVSDAVGVASHLGRVTMHTEHCTPAGDEITNGHGTLTAANGDTIEYTYAGTAVVPPDAIAGETVFPVDVDITYTGGTGRFRGVTGSGGSQSALILFGGFGVSSWPGCTWMWNDVTISY